MSCISLVITEQTSVLDDYTVYHCHLTSKTSNKGNLLRYEKKERAVEILHAFKIQIVDSFDNLENFEVGYVAVRPDGIYACIRLKRNIKGLIEDMQKKDRENFVFEEVKIPLMNALHYFW